MSSALRSSFLSLSTTQSRLQNPSPVLQPEPSPPSLRLVQNAAASAVLPFPPIEQTPRPHLSAELRSAAAKRFAAFCAEAAVLVFVLGILDRFLIRNRIEPVWIAGAFVLSLLLLGVSVVVDVAAHRWRV